MSTMRFDEWENSDGEAVLTEANAAGFFGVG